MFEASKAQVVIVFIFRLGDFLLDYSKQHTLLYIELGIKELVLGTFFIDRFRLFLVQVNQQAPITYGDL